MIFGIILVVTAAVVILVAVKMPKHFLITRSLLMNAPPAKIFPYLIHTRRLQEWNPFIENDPTVKTEFAGPEEGVGAQYSWEGNSQSGKGKLTIVEIEENKKVVVRLDFEKPFKATNFGEYSLRQEGSATLMTWSIDETNKMARFMSLIIDLDNIIGTNFEKGLLKLKALTERGNL